MNTVTLTKLLKARYQSNGYAFFTNVSDGTGSNASRWADGLAMSLWPSRGLAIEGFEIKVSRADWQKELSKPEKAEAVCKYCDYWWVVAGDDSIVKDGELPPTWGLMCAKGDKLSIKVKAPRLNPIALDRVFVAAIARRACEQSAEADALQAARQEGMEAGRAERAWELKDLQALKKRVAAFQETTGIDLEPSSYTSFRWSDPKEIGRAVLMVLQNEADYQRQIEHMRRAANRILEIVGDKQPDELPAKNHRRRVS